MSKKHRKYLDPKEKEDDKEERPNLGNGWETHKEEPDKAKEKGEDKKQ
jgi:hypothetical protein